MISYLEIEDNFETGMIDKCNITSITSKFSKKFPILPFGYKLFEDESLYINSTLISELFEYSLTVATVTAKTDLLITDSFDVITNIGCFYET